MFCSNCKAGSNRNSELYVQHDTIPHLVHIEMTYACNAHCIFCYNPERGKLGDLDKIDPIVESVVKSRIPHVYLIGGEPSLVPVDRLNRYIEMLAPYSSVTIVTNGIRRLEGISPKLACFGVPLHGATPAMHEFHNQFPGSFETVINNIAYYVEEGFDVRCIPVLTGYNYGQLFDIIGIAASLGMESVYVDRYEDGGLGAQQALNKYPSLKPSLEQFRYAVTQMLNAREQFPRLEGRIGFGTAIPYCIDPRMVEKNMTSNCGVGTYFGAINPKGDFRICNQSQIVFGNVLEQPLEVIWNNPEIDCFRNLDWVEEPCRSCPLLLDCTCGCKVDVNYSNEFSIDYAVREAEQDELTIPEERQRRDLEVTYPKDYRTFRPGRYMKLNTEYVEKFLVTRYQTVKLGPNALWLALLILDGGVTSEEELIAVAGDEVEEEEIRIFISKLAQINAIRIDKD